MIPLLIDAYFLFRQGVSVRVWGIFLPAETKFWPRLYFHKHVSFCPQGGVPDQAHPLGPGRYTPPGPGRYTTWTRQVHPQTRQVHPWGRYTPQTRYTPPGPGIPRAGTPPQAGTLPPDQVHPHGPGRYTSPDQTPPWTRQVPPGPGTPPGPGRYTPRARHPPRPGTAPWAGTPPQTRQVHPPDQAGTPIPP